MARKRSPCDWPAARRLRRPHLNAELLGKELRPVALLTATDANLLLDGGNPRLLHTLQTSAWGHRLFQV